MHPGKISYSERSVTPGPTHEPQLAIRQPFLRVLGWCVLAAIGGAIIYFAFTMLTGMETSLVGIPAGLAVGQTMFYASGKRGGRRYQVLAVFLAFVAFDITYAPGMTDVALKDGITVPAFGFFVFMTVISPVIDAQNGFLGEFMVLAGMYLAWTLARTR
ncbi:MAG: hypothetical protein HYX27_04365 [Acidobacteria bacterium]|nr:hypothetical protein [Acidobacteriota bacterium]